MASKNSMNASRPPADAPMAHHGKRQARGFFTGYRLGESIILLRGLLGRLLFGNAILGGLFPGHAGWGGGSPIAPMNAPR
jgi:hypothetical protein